jgi:hypothetical protein
MLRDADAITQGVPVSVLDDEYGRSTLAMASLVDKFAALDLYDPERVKVSSYAICKLALHGHIRLRKILLMCRACCVV